MLRELDSGFGVVFCSNNLIRCFEFGFDNLGCFWYKEWKLSYNFNLK